MVIPELEPGETRMMTVIARIVRSAVPVAPVTGTVTATAVNYEGVASSGKAVVVKAGR
jgi:hypothetical protein